MDSQNFPNDYLRFQTVIWNSEKSPRLGHEPFPSYSYVPRRFPHPIREPKGHSYGLAETRVDLHDGALCNCQHYINGIDLFNNGFYWESHETWEAVWHALGRTTTLARFVQGLIKLAAAGVKAREGNANGIQRHASRAMELFKQSHDLRVSVTGFSLSELLVAATWIQTNGRLLINTSPAAVEIVVPFSLKPQIDG